MLHPKIAGINPDSKGKIWNSFCSRRKPGFDNTGFSGHKIGWQFASHEGIAASLVQPGGFAGCISVSVTVTAQVSLGDAPTAPKSVAGLPGRGGHPLDVTGTFNVNTDSREQVREFYNAIYPASANVPMNSTTVTTNCFPGTNGTAFQNATLRRINWFRAMAGISGGNHFRFRRVHAGSGRRAHHVRQQRSGAYRHTTHLELFQHRRHQCGGSLNLALGYDGADAITGYILDFGTNNTAAGHRRWILYPQTQVMAAGDVPAESGFSPANATWVFDANYGGPRPTTTKPYVTWPPEGFVPYPLVYPQWSFALSNADFSAATVSMKSNGVSVAVALQPVVTGAGENTLVWVPMGLDATSANTIFPFGGTDTVYSVTVSNINFNSAFVKYTYNVTLFDPAGPGTDYVATVVSGTNTPYLNTANAYTCAPPANPNVTGYQWLVSQFAPGNLVDNATSGQTNFTASPAPTYPITTNPPTGSGQCFHLCHVNPVSEILNLNELIVPATNAMISFKSLLGYAFADEVAHLQVSMDGGANWQDLFTEAGCNPNNATNNFVQCDSVFTSHSYSLSNYAGQVTLLRFNYSLPTGSFNTFNGADNYLGWSLENITVTNVQQFIGATTNTTVTTNFTFTPAQLTNYFIAAAPVLFTQFPLSWGPVRQFIRRQQSEHRHRSGPAGADQQAGANQLHRQRRGLDLPPAANHEPGR